MTLADAAAVMGLLCASIRISLRPENHGDVWEYRAAEALRDDLEAMAVDEARGLLVRRFSQAAAA